MAASGGACVCLNCKICQLRKDNPTIGMTMIFRTELLFDVESNNDYEKHVVYLILCVLLESFVSNQIYFTLFGLPSAITCIL